MSGSIGPSGSNPPIQPQDTTTTTSSSTSSSSTSSSSSSQPTQQMYSAHSGGAGKVANALPASLQTELAQILLQYESSVSSGTASEQQQASNQATDALNTAITSVAGPNAPTVPYVQDMMAYSDPLGAMQMQFTNTINFLSDHSNR